MNEFKPFEDKLAGLIAALSPASRRSMTVEIAKKLRQRQQQRIKSQKSPDSTPYAPRKRQPIKAKKGRIKREMFTKLRTNRFMKAKGDDNAAVVEFTRKVQRIARVHQYGLRDRPSPRSKEVQYEARPLLGFDSVNQQQLEEIIINHLSLN
ncbi:phage virion morphogenesis protein [Yersinia enterocolitica]|nr:phage virion morphogenesis protein [Yersinia enterocolitica]EKN5942469.1 phage virion morphogenesis protein [Yersinia enterocolitica]EKN6222216.1 phage virion morphogenesis protein [Yersinia enterocolitica]ELI8406970.1 phage virion morphogenesis protein [Yersinia enterocolitica]HDL7764361.1 phage virion morphogenesis protein [Yersinia enterocolitica]